MYLQQTCQTWGATFSASSRFNFVNRFLSINTTLCGLLAEARLLVELLEEGRLDPVARLQHRLALVLVYDGVHHLREMLPEVRRHLSYVLRVFRDLQIQPPFDVLHRDPHDVLFGQLVLKRDWSLDAFPFFTFFTLRSFCKVLSLL
jgi:hypothetical protein